MEEVEIIGSFDSEDTAQEVAQALNRWFIWIMEGDPEDIPELFEDLGLSTEDYALDREGDVDWEEPPHAEPSGANVIVTATTSETIDTLQEVIAALGAYDVSMGDEDDG